MRLAFLAGLAAVSIVAFAPKVDAKVCANGVGSACIHGARTARHPAPVCRWVGGHRVCR
jgi:hypothetical protein